MDKKKEYLEELKKQIDENAKLDKNLTYAKNVFIPLLSGIGLIVGASYFFPTIVSFAISIPTYLCIALSGQSIYDAYQDEEKKRLIEEEKEIKQETITAMDNTKDNKKKLETDKTENDKIIEEEEENHKKLKSKLKVRENWFRGSIIAYFISIAGVILLSPYFLAGITVSAVSSIGMAIEIKNKKEEKEQSLCKINTAKRLNELIGEKIDIIKKVLSSSIEEGKEKEPVSTTKTKSKTPTTSDFIPLEGYFGPPKMERGKVKTLGTR